MAWFVFYFLRCFLSLTTNGSQWQCRAIGNRHGWYEVQPSGCQGTIGRLTVVGGNLEVGLPQPCLSCSLSFTVCVFCGGGLGPRWYSNSNQAASHHSNSSVFALVDHKSSMLHYTSQSTAKPRTSKSASFQ